RTGSSACSTRRLNISLMKFRQNISDYRLESAAIAWWQ
ncbi:MAG: hypothetical protein ACI8P0_004764, partial [Planctomycetaceae bacterium]